MSTAVFIFTYLHICVKIYRSKGQGVNKTGMKMRRYYITVSVAAILFILGVAVFAAFTKRANTVVSEGNAVKINEMAADTGDAPDDISAALAASYDRISGRLVAGLAIFGLIVFTAAILYGRYIDKHFVKPLNDMKTLAGRIAEGNLGDAQDVKRDNVFAPFAQSFDIMREELSRSREREIAFQEKECDLLVSLSRELKTPVAGLRLMTELTRTRLLTGGDPENDRAYIADMLDKMYARSEQVENRVSTLLSSALEDLGEFRVSCSDVESHILGDMVRRFDEKKLVTMQTIPFVLIHIDTKRMRQVIGNIMDNAYKYAKTGIDVSFLQMDEYMQMKITDRGPGVADDEIGLITNRFYRGRKQADGDIEGSGLGLYIAKTSMENMGGQLLVENTGSGLCVTLLIKLS